MTPFQQNVYRARTATIKHYNAAQKTCISCKQRRSVAQFVAGDDRCQTCRRRAPR